MKFIHTSDWHLGRVFHGVQLMEDQSYALDCLEEIVKSDKPDVLLVAGDVYDRSVPPVVAVELLDDFLGRVIRRHKIPVVMIPGNHDSSGRLSFASRLLQEQGLHIVGDPKSLEKPIVIEDSHGPVNIFAIPFMDPAQVRSAGICEDAKDHDEAMGALVEFCLSCKPKGRTLAIAHAFVAGGKESESERRLSIGGASQVSAVWFGKFDYVALGHLHRPQKADGTAAEYSGSLLKYSFSETDDIKGVVLGEMDAKGAVTTEFVKIEPLRDVRCFEGRFNDLLKPKGSRKSREDYLEVTLTDRGPVLDAMERLREHYPNVLNIRRKTPTGGSSKKGGPIDPEKVDRMELFSRFFEDVTGEKLTIEQKKAFAGVLCEVEKEQEED
jgi:exonuclease SbcD